MNCPPIPRPLLEWLEKVFPNDVLPLGNAPSVSSAALLREVGVAVGKQEVVKRLRTEYNKQHS